MLQFNRGPASLWANKYRVVDVIGEGSFAKVYKAFDYESRRTVAVKKFNPNSCDVHPIPISIIREMKVLKQMNHDNVLKLLDTFIDDDRYPSFVLEFMETDLDALIYDKSVNLNYSDIKRYVTMTLMGLQYLHSEQILHRDLKPKNILINRSGILKLADFGISKHYDAMQEMTNQVVTLWYRAPELLLGSNRYDYGIDMWSLGCVISELLLRRVLFKGNNEMDQLGKIIEIRGSPKITSSSLTIVNYMQFKNAEPKPLKEVFPGAFKGIIDVINNCLALDPKDRCNPTELYAFRYFNIGPKATPCNLLPLPSRINHKVEGYPAVASNLKGGKIKDLPLNGSPRLRRKTSTPIKKPDDEGPRTSRISKREEDFERGLEGDVPISPIPVPKKKKSKYAKIVANAFSTPDESDTNNEGEADPEQEREPKNIRRKKPNKTPNKSKLNKK